VVCLNQENLRVRISPWSAPALRRFGPILKMLDVARVECCEPKRRQAAAGQSAAGPAHSKERHVSRATSHSRLAPLQIYWTNLGRKQRFLLTCCPGRTLLIITARSNLPTVELAFAPEERHVYSYTHAQRSRSVRSETRCRNSREVGKSVALLRSFRVKKRTPGYKHLAPLGRREKTSGPRYPLCRAKRKTERGNAEGGTSAK
jgi:hypothetical protein